MSLLYLLTFPPIFLPLNLLMLILSLENPCGLISLHHIFETLYAILQLHIGAILSLMIIFPYPTTHFFPLIPHTPSLRHTMQQSRILCGSKPSKLNYRTLTTIILGTLSLFLMARSLYVVNGCLKWSWNPMVLSNGTKPAWLLKFIHMNTGLIIKKRSLPLLKWQPSVVFFLLLLLLLRIDLSSNWTLIMRFSMVTSMKRFILFVLLVFLMHPIQFASYVSPFMALNRPPVSGLLSSILSSISKASHSQIMILPSSSAVLVLLSHLLRFM